MDGTRATVTYEGSVDGLLRAALTGEVVDLTSKEQDLEEIFLA